MSQEQKQNATQELSEILQVRRDKLAELCAEGKNPFEHVKYDRTHYTVEIEENFEALEETDVVVAGRLMSKRGMGKVMFCDLQDYKGRIQLFIKKDVLGEDNYMACKKLDVGDIVKSEAKRS